MRRNQKSFKSPANPNSQQMSEGNQISPYDVIRMKNCKLFNFRRDEMYPSIRPPVSQCDPEETAAFLAASIEADGLGRFDPRSLRRETNNVSPLLSARKMDRSNELRIINPCRTRKIEEPIFKSGIRRDPHMVLDWSKITPYDLMRLQNCKAFDFQKCERYPNIRPPVSPCGAEWTAQWLASAIENYGCPRLFDMEIDDILDIWKRSPGKDSLGFYGVGSGIQTPEAIEYNQLVAKCLEKVSRQQREEKRKEDVKSPLAKLEVKPAPKSPGIFLLNRSKLESKVTKMPTVQKKLHPSTALTWIHCPRRATSQPFLEAPKSAPNMEKPVRKSKHPELKKKQQFCDMQFEVPENQCTDYEWMKYKEVPVSYEAVFQKELEELAKEFENEPKNYDELYSQLISCFEKDVLKDPIAASYYKCCKRFSKSGGAGKGGKGRGRHGDGDGEGDSLETGAENDVEDGEEEGAEDNEQGIGFGGIEGEGEGGGEPSTFGLGGKEGAGDKNTATVGVGTSATSALGSGDGKNKKVTKADKASGTDGKKKAPKPAKDQGKKPAKGPDPKDQAGKLPGAVKTFEMPNMLESVTEGESSLHEHKSYMNLLDGELGESSISSFWKGPSQQDSKRKGKGGKRKGSKSKGRGPKSGKERPSTDSAQLKNPDCPCEICEVMNRRGSDPPDPPYILEMIKEQKYRQVIEYHRRLCHQAYLLWKCPEYPAPPHQCDPIKCDEPSSFGLNPKIAEYFDRLNALNNLQRLLCSKKHDQVDHQLLFLVQNLKDRLSWRLNQFL